MENQEVAEEAKQETPVVPESAVPGQFVGGEVHIIADPSTGEIRVNAPQNLVIAFGLIEAGKLVLVNRQQELMKRAELQRAKQPPAILRADGNALKSLDKLARPS